MRITLIFLATIAIAACNSMPKAVSHLSAPKPSVSEDTATVVVMRPRHSGVTSPNSVAVDGKEMVAISQGQYSWFQLPPGEYTLTETTPWYHADISGANANSSSHAVTLKNGKTYYLSFHEELQSMRDGVGITFAGGTPIAYPEFSATYVRYWKEYDAVEGNAHMKIMRYVAPSTAMLNK